MEPNNIIDNQFTGIINEYINYTNNKKDFEKRKEDYYEALKSVLEDYGINTTNLNESELDEKLTILFEKTKTDSLLENIYGDGVSLHEEEKELKGRMEGIITKYRNSINTLNNQIKKMEDAINRNEEEIESLSNTDEKKLKNHNLISSIQYENGKLNAQILLLKDALEKYNVYSKDVSEIDENDLKKLVKIQEEIRNRIEKEKEESAINDWLFDEELEQESEEPEQVVEQQEPEQEVEQQEPEDEELGFRWGHTAVDPKDKRIFSDESRDRKFATTIPEKKEEQQENLPAEVKQEGWLKRLWNKLFNRKKKEKIIDRREQEIEDAKKVTDEIDGFMEETDREEENRKFEMIFDIDEQEELEERDDDWMIQIFPPDETPELEESGEVVEQAAKDMFGYDTGMSPEEMHKKQSEIAAKARETAEEQDSIPRFVPTNNPEKNEGIEQEDDGARF